MGWRKSLQDEPEGLGSNSETPGNGDVSENLIQQYFKLRYQIESSASKGVEPANSEYKRCIALKEQLKRAGVDVEDRYQKFKAEKRSMPKEESEALDVAEEMYPDSDTEIVTATIFKTAKKGEEIITRRETETIRQGGRPVAKITTTILVTACGKKISSEDEIAGFCDVCEEAVCSEHVQHCKGYKGFPCHKLLCPRHTFYFPEQDGTEQPYCLDHYEMKLYYQQNIVDSGSEPEKKLKDSEENKDSE